MDPAYFAWKLAALLVTPSNFLLLAATFCTVWMMRTTKHRRLAMSLSIVALAGLVLCAFSPLPALALRTLETRFPPLDANALEVPPAAIVVLGGGVSVATFNGRREDSLNDAADRVRLGARLARQFETTPIYVLGGQAFASAGGAPEADAMARMLQELGVNRERIILERNSRTTAENAQNFRAALGEAPLGDASHGPILLVTSAFHMPRAIATLRAQCLNPIAAPTDWRISDRSSALSWTAAGALATADIAARELLGLMAYRLNGASSELFPGPIGKTCARPQKWRST